jgi:hypothetical protein
LRCSEERIQTHVFLASAVVGGGWSASFPRRFTLGGGNLRYPLDTGLSGSQCRCGRYGEVKILTIPELELRHLGRPFRSQSLYRLPYHGYFCIIIIIIIIYLFIIIMLLFVWKKVLLICCRTGLAVLIDVSPCLLSYLVSCTHEPDVWDLQDQHVQRCADQANWAVILRACLFGRFRLPERERIHFLILCGDLHGCVRSSSLFSWTTLSLSFAPVMKASILLLQQRERKREREGGDRSNKSCSCS